MCEYDGSVGKTRMTLTGTTAWAAREIRQLLDLLTLRSIYGVDSVPRESKTLREKMTQKVQLKLQLQFRASPLLSVID